MATAKAKTAPKQSKPGYNPQAERAYLFTLYQTDKETFTRWAGITDITDFDEPKHEAVFEALVGVHDAGDARDSVTVHAWLSEHRKLHLWPNWESEIFNEDANLLRIATYGRTVIENGILRQTRDVSMQLYQGSITTEEAGRRLEYLQGRTADIGQTKTPQIAGTMLSEVKTQPVRWLWRGYIARGKMAIIDGDPGQGKGLLSHDLTARVTRGLPMPSEIYPGEPAGVIMLTPEDDPADTIRPRLEAAGADLDRVRILSTAKNEDGSERFITIPRDVLTIETAIRHDGAHLLIIDPITACLDAGVKTHVDTEVRAALKPLDDMARRTGCAVVLVRHMNKGGGDNALYRGSGSIAYTAACRTAFIVATHPDSSDIRVLAPVKSNISKLSPALTFSIIADSPDAWPHISWDREPCDLHANELLSTRQSQEARDVMRILKEANKPLSPSEVATELGISEKDKTGQATIRQRLLRMAKNKRILSPSYGVYTTMSHLSHLSQSSQLSQLSQLDDESVTGVTGVTGSTPVTRFERPVTLRACMVCGQTMKPHPDGGYWPCNH